jgi:phosphatidylserine/phosphatidylglycerophosphate/cardiolipin synthase-like enzyme
MLAVEGPVVPVLRNLFLKDWRRTTRRALPGTRPLVVPACGDEIVQPLVSSRGRGELGHRLRGAVRGARRRVDIANAYFVPGFPLRRALRRAARRGVSVRLLLPGQRNDHFAVWSAGRRHYHGLLAAGVRIYEWQRGMLHAKLATVDDAWAYVGSSNLDRWSARFNLELDLGLRTPGGVAAVSERFEADLASAREITISQWEARPLSLRLFERVFGWFDPLL